MFDRQTYMKRRKRLKETIRSGVVLFVGNTESAKNFPDNCYPFRQDSTFLYFWGLDMPGAAALIDVENDLDLVFASDPAPDDFIWSGPPVTLDTHAENAGAKAGGSLDALYPLVAKAVQQNRPVHFLPPYRPDNTLRISALLNMPWAQVTEKASVPLIKAVVSLRSIKTPEEIVQLEEAVEITREMHLLAMTLSRPGVTEREVVGAMSALAYGQGAPHMSFQPIFTTDGHILHNPYHRNTLNAGELVINDSGVESPGHYAADITRTFPVSGRFSAQQREIYAIVLKALEKAIESIRPGVAYRDVHLNAARDLVIGLTELGLMKGDADEAVAAGAHALFFPCGLGHMMGMDAHDMEDLGESYVGYTEDVRRSSQFGLSRLRLAKELETGFVVTVEPGIYFSPPLIDRWAAEGLHQAFIDYSALGRYRKFGGVRIEEDVLVEESGARVLGTPLAKSIDDVEAISSERK